jgi:hypothetical protein
MSLSSFCFKNKRLLCFVAFLILGFLLIQISSSIKEKEGLAIDWTKLTPVKKSCGEDNTTCDACAKTYVKGNTESDNILCAWNSNTSKCESSTDSSPIGYFSCPNSNTISNSNPACSTCPQLKLVDTPTWISVK